MRPHKLPQHFDIKKKVHKLYRNASKLQVEELRIVGNSLQPNIYLSIYLSICMFIYIKSCFFSFSLAYFLYII